MARIIIELPDSFSFSKTIELDESYMNIANHLDNALLLKLVGATRTAYWSHMGYSPFDMEGVSNVVADAALQYKSEAFNGEVMLIEQALRDFHKYGFDTVWRITEKSSQREIARGKHGILCFNYEQRKIAPIPEKLRTRLQADQQKD